MAEEITSKHTADAPTEPLTRDHLDLAIGDYTLAEVIGEGPFSTVYKGLHSDGSIKAFKVARPFADLYFAGKTALYHTEALIQQTGIVGRARIDPASLLCKQADKLLSVNHKSLPKIEKLVASPRRTYYQAEFIEGDTLRTVIAKNTATVAMVLDAARAMDELLRLGFGYHGDLKPENIIVSPDGVRLLDPGYFDRDSGVNVTTALYYPQPIPDHFIPDDLLAIGLMLWEVILGEHPLDRCCSSYKFAACEFSESLWNFVRSKEMVGNYRFSPLLALKRPTFACPELTPDLEKVLLKSLRLCVNKEGLIDVDQGYRSFSELISELETARKQRGQSTQLVFH